MRAREWSGARLVATAVLAACACSCASGAEAGGPGEAALSLTHRMMMLVLQLGALLFAARLGHLTFERLGMPGSLGELCAGVAVGPYALGRFSVPGFPGGLFPEFYQRFAGGGELRFVVSPELYGVCMLAAVVLLFMVGLETDLRLFLRYSVAGTLVGAGGVVASFLCGDLLAVWLLPRVTPGSYSAASPACIFLGVMATATSVSVTARILAEQRRLDAPEGVTILAGAVIDDVLGIIMLAVGMGVVSAAGGAGLSGVDWRSIARIAAEAVGLWLAATAAGVLAARRIGTLLKELGGRNDIAFLALGLALIVSGLFERARLSMIIGSYVMGLALSRTDISHLVRERLQPVFGLLVPVFFAVMGMMVDLHSLLAPEVLLFGLAYTAACVAAKLVGCGLPALLCGFSGWGALRVGVGMVPRGEVALIVAVIGLSAGFVSKEVFGAAVLMTLLTTLAAPPLLLKAFRHDADGLRGGRRRPVPASAPLAQYAFPNEEIAALLTGSLLNAFSREGFFAHALNASEGLYQARKEERVITIRRRGCDIAFEATPEAEGVIRLLMIEVIVEFEQTLEELHKPLGAAALTRELAEAERASKSRRETLVRYLSRDALVPSLKGTTREEVVAELVGVLARLGWVERPEVALADVLRREEAMSTGLRHGIACPHARTDAVQRLVCAVGLKPEGVDFRALDEKPSEVIVLTLCPAAGGAPYLEFISSVIFVLSHGETLREALASRTSGELYRTLTHGGPERIPA